MIIFIANHKAVIFRKESNLIEELYDEAGLPGSEPGPTVLSQKNNEFFRGMGIRTSSNGFGDRCATIDTMPLQNSCIFEIT